ncbi:hypothetical protein ABTA65_20345, partial [Acinetobacter baumannii]
MTESLSALVGQEGNRMGMFTLVRTTPGITSATQHEVLARFLPHVSRAVKISRRFMEMVAYAQVGDA